MDSEVFRKTGRQMLDYITEYLDQIRERRVTHNVSPGYMKSLLPTEAPDKPEDFSTIFKDIEEIIMPGMTHWHHPKFHGYFASGHSYSSFLGDLLSDAIGCIGFSWNISPACTELEVITTDWLGKILGLPKEFLHCSPGKGGGVIQGSASETVLLCLVSARTRIVTKYKKRHPQINEVDIMSKLVGYTSDQASSSVLKSGLLAAIHIKLLDTDDKCSVRGNTLRKAIEEDTKEGKIPFFLCATLGTTGTCGFDNIQELGTACQENDIWLHIDAAYAGSAFVCPEFRHYMKGIEYAQSININAHKWMLVNFDLSVMWIKDSSLLVDAFNIDPIYLHHDNERHVPDFRHWQIPLGRRFRSLKLWFMLRSYGVTGVQQYIRGGPNTLTEKLLDKIIADGRIYLVPSVFRKVYFLRLAICAERTNSDDITFSYSIVKKCADSLLPNVSTPISNKHESVIDVNEPMHQLNINEKYHDMS